MEVDDCNSLEVPKTVLLRPTDDSLLQVHDSLLQVDKHHYSCVQLFNPTGVSCHIEAGSKLGEVEEVDVVTTEQDGTLDTTQRYGGRAQVRRVTSSEVAARREKLCEIVGKPKLLTPTQTEELHEFLGEHHSAFALDANERGETDLLTMEIATGDAAPKRQAPRRLPLTVRSEVAKQLREMQSAGVVELSSSPWACPVVMVHKWDGSHRFCIDHRQLNAVTKADMFPLPRIDDLLNQLEAAQYFTTLDLASGYWQIRMHPDSAEKTAFVTPQGLFQFSVMPFGLTNAPSVFQRLMERVLAGLNQEEASFCSGVHQRRDRVLAHFGRSLTAPVSSHTTDQWSNWVAKSLFQSGSCSGSNRSPCPGISSNCSNGQSRSIINDLELHISYGRDYCIKILL